jgi:hypothetical protein
MLREIHRTTFVRQSANLWSVKDQLWRHALRHIRFDPAISLVDSFPVPVARRACFEMSLRSGLSLPADEGYGGLWL